MKNQYQAHKSQLVKTIGVLTVSTGLLLMMPLAASAIQIKVTVENISQEQGVFLSPFWLGLHDGSFDTFTPATTASLPLEIVAEDGIIGLEPTVPQFIPLFNAAIAAGAELPDPEDTIAGLFSASTPDGIQSLAFANVFGFPQGSQFSITTTIDPNLHNNFSYAAIVVPSHDGFVADVDPISLFSPQGVFQPQQSEIRGSDVYDAGTETNDEDLNTTPISFNSPAQFFGAVRQGTPEGGTIQKHPLLREVGQGGFLDLPQFSNADFTRSPDQIFARITVEEVPEPTTILGAGLLLALGVLFKRLRSQS